MASGNVVGILEAIFTLRDEVSPALDRIAKSLDKTGGALKDIGAPLSVVSAALLAGGVMAVKAAGDYEQLQIAFKTMLGSGEAAQKFLNELQAFAARTPFEFKGLAQSAQGLIAMGFAAKDVIPMLTSIGDAAAGLGLGADVVQRLVNQLGQMQARGKVAGEEMRVLAQTGIPVWDILAQKIGVTVPEAMKLVEQGAVSASTGIAALLEGMNKRFGGMMEAQSKTLLGQLSTLKDEFSFILRDFGTALLPLATGALQAFQAVVPYLRDAVQWFKQLPEPVRMTVAGAIALAAAVGPIILGLGIVVSTVSSMVVALGTLGVTVGGVSVGLMGLAAVLGTVTAAGVAFVVGFKIGEWARESIPGLAAATDAVVQFHLKILGIQAVLDMYNKRQEQGVDVTKTWTAEQRASFEAFKARQILTQADVHLNQDLFASIKPVVDATKTATAATNADLLAGINAVKNKKLLAEASAALGRNVTDLAEAKRVLAIATANSAEAMNKAREAAEKLSKADRDLTQASMTAAEAEIAGWAKADESLGKHEAAMLAGAEAAEVALMRQEFGLRDLNKVIPESTGLWTRYADVVETEVGNAFEAAAEKAKAAEKALADAVRTERLHQFADGLRGIADLLGGTLGGAVGVFGDLADDIANGVDAISAATNAASGLGQVLNSSASPAAQKFGGALSGAAAGAKMGTAILPGWGTAIGAVGGAIAGFIVGGQKMIKQVNDMRDAFFESKGGFEAFSKSMAKVSSEDWAKKIFNAKTVEEFNALVKEAQGLLDTQGMAQEKLNEAVQKYGFTIDELGPKWAAQELDKKAGELLQDYELLKASGIDVNTIIARMGPNLVEYVDTARKAGVAIPESMRPVIEQLIASGQLLDENGEAFTSVEDAGLSFSKTLSEGMAEVVEQIKALVAALTGIPQSVPPIHVPVVYDDPGRPYHGPDEEQAAAGFDAMVFGPTRFLAGEAGPERVTITPQGQTPRGSSGSDPEIARALQTLALQQQQLPYQLKKALTSALQQARA